MLPRQLCQAAQMAREMDRTKGVQDRKQSAVSKTPPPNPLPYKERGRRRETVWLAPPLRCGEGVGGRGFRHSRSNPLRFAQPQPLEPALLPERSDLRHSHHQSRRTPPDGREPAPVRESFYRRFTSHRPPAAPAVERPAAPCNERD